MKLRSGSVELRPFEPGLSGVLYEIRNHPTVRRHMRDPSPIPRESHERWVQENLVAERRLALFIVYASGAPVGLALLRNIQGGTAEIGVMIVEANRRRLVGYKAAHLTGYYAFEVLGVEKIYSYVPRHNQHALAFNLACGLEKTDIENDTYFVLALAREGWRTHPVHARFRDRHAVVLVD